MIPQWLTGNENQSLIGSMMFNGFNESPTSPEIFRGKKNIGRTSWGWTARCWALEACRQRSGLMWSYFSTFQDIAISCWRGKMFETLGKCWKMIGHEENPPWKNHVFIMSWASRTAAKLYRATDRQRRAQVCENQRPGRWSSNKSRSVFMALCAQIQRFQSCTVDCSKM